MSFFGGRGLKISAMFFSGDWGGDTKHWGGGGRNFHWGVIRFSVFPNISEKKFSPAAGLN